MSTIRGTFKSRTNALTYTMQIEINNSEGTVYTITDPTYFGTQWGTRRTDPHIFWAEDPIHISHDFSDVEQHIKISSATIHLVSNINLVELFGVLETNKNSYLSNKPTIQIYNANYIDEGNEIFNGIVEDDIFQMDYSQEYTAFSIQATDRLASYKYLYAVESALCADEHTSLNILEGNPLYINSIPQGTLMSSLPIDPSTIIPTNLAVSPDIFGANTTIRDDWMNLYDSYEEILKYLNLYVMAVPNATYTLPKVAAYAWPASYTISNDSVVLNAEDDAAGDDTTLSNSESYSVIKVNCNIEPLERLVDFGTNASDNTSLTSDYRSKIKYMTEIVSPGEGENAWDSFKNMVLNNQIDDYKNAYTIDNYLYVKKSSAWDFTRGYESSYYRDMYDYTKLAETTAGEDGQFAGRQHLILNFLKREDSNPIKAAWLSFGRSQKQTLYDDSLGGQISTKDCLYITVWGQEDHTENHFLKSKINAFTSEHPLAKYTPWESITLTPTTANVTNYIIISGNIMLNPTQVKTGTKWWYDYYPTFPFSYKTWLSSTYRHFPKLVYERSMNTFDDAATLCRNNGDPTYRCCPENSNHEDGGYYTQKFWKRNDTDHTYSQYSESNQYFPYGDLQISKNKKMEFEYSAVRDNTDKISKLAILKCELKVGDKYCCETLEKEDEFVWMTANEITTYNSVNNKNLEPYIYVGINPKIGDFIVGQSFQIQNTISDEMNLSTKGMAIPIKSTDAVSGKFEFKIIGPVDCAWDDIEYIKPSFWRHSKWNTYSRSIMEATQAIIIEDFKIDTMGDNALANVEATSTDKDLVYASDMNPRYSEEKEIDLKICSGLSDDECAEYGISNKISNSFVIDTTTNAPYLGTATQTTGFYYKQEERICDSLFKELCRPKTIIKTTINRSNKINEKNLPSKVYSQFYINWWDPYKPTKIMKADFDLKNETIECEFKEFVPGLANI